MRWWPEVVLVLGLVGCNDKDNGSGDTDSGAPPVTIDIGTSAEAIDASAEIGQPTVQAHQAVNSLLSAAALVIAEPHVQSRLDIDNGATRATPCWVVPSVVQTTFTIDYSTCSDLIDTTGVVEINDHPAGPVIFNFVQLTIGGRVLNGTLAFDKTGANPLSWTAYDSIATSPIPENRSPIGVTVNGDLRGVTLDGGAKLAPFVDEWQLWGQALVQSATIEAGALVGGTDPAALTTSVAPPAAPTSSFDFIQCRCPSSGDSAYDVTLALDELTFDLDALKNGDDGVDDPEIQLDIDQSVTGQAVVTTTACGEYETAFVAEDIVTTVDAATLSTEIRAKCDSLVIDAPRCDAWLAAVEIAGSFDITLPAAKVTAEVQEAVTTQFDGPWCQY